MYQNFEVLKSVDRLKRLTLLRQGIKKNRLNGFLIPRSDLYQNEYIEPRDSRLEWITGFTGSAGICLVTLESAFIFVDGRYGVQAKKEIDINLFQIVKSADITFNNWFKEHCINQEVGFDPWLHTVSQLNELASNNINQVKLKKCANLIDQIWTQKPQRAPFLIETHPQKFSGAASKKKRQLISKVLTENKADAVILTKPDSICWLLNIRGKDISHTPIIQCTAIVEKNSCMKLFLHNTEVPNSIKKFLGTDVEIIHEDSFKAYLNTFRTKSIQIDPISCPMAIFDRLKLNNNEIIQRNDPCILPKAIKNTTEIKGARAAHLIDAVAFVKFLFWLSSATDTSSLDEIQVTKKLENFRRNTAKLEEIAFDTICGAGSNGAIIHYKVTRKTNKKLQNNNLLLIDSGGQYRMGTTDLTRTIAVGSPPQKMIDIFTHVLKGMIAISDLKWPEGLSGQHIDILARTSLWSIGLDYDHGTGHGLGSYLSVHEGPQGISRRNNTSLMPGMLISNEPGYYEPEEFGIRTENVLLVKRLQKKQGKKIQMLAFETLTLVPIDTKLVNKRILNKKEKDWLNEYHKSVYQKLAPHLSSDTKAWLKKICAPI